MHPIGANGMPPGKGKIPDISEGIVLKEQMVLALIVHEPIGVVHPVVAGVKWN